MGHYDQQIHIGIRRGLAVCIRTEQNHSSGVKLVYYSLYERSDVLSFDQQLSAAMMNAITFDLDWAFINGTGAGMPQGILNAGSKITVAKESGQVADTIVFENIVNMWSRLHLRLHQA